MAVQTVPYTINPTKETKEVVDLLSHLIDELKAKKPWEQVAASTFPKLVTAVDGIDKLDDEAKSKNLDDNIAYLTKVLGDRLIPSAAGEEGEL